MIEILLFCLWLWHANTLSMHPSPKKDWLSSALLFFHFLAQRNVSHPLLFTHGHGERKSILVWAYIDICIHQMGSRQRQQLQQSGKKRYQILVCASGVCMHFVESSSRFSIAQIVLIATIFAQRTELSSTPLSSHY